MKAGDRIQVSQFDAGRHWIYATVLAPYDDGSALVRIDHPGNLDHEKIKVVSAEGIRTKAAVQTLLDTWKPDANESMQKNANERAGLFHQLEQLS